MAWLTAVLGIPPPACRNIGIRNPNSLVSGLSQLKNKLFLFLPTAQMDGSKQQLEGIPSKEAHFREAAPTAYE